MFSLTGTVELSSVDVNPHVDEVTLAGEIVDWVRAAVLEADLYL